MAGIRRPNMVSSPCGNIPQKHTICSVRNLSSKLSLQRGTASPGSAPSSPGNAAAARHQPAGKRKIPDAFAFGISLEVTPGFESVKPGVTQV